jgi:hypothetical protein
MMFEILCLIADRHFGAGSAAERRASVKCALPR